MMISVAVLAGLSVAAAQEEEAATEPAAVEIDFSQVEAEAVEDFSRREMRWLKPKRRRLPQNPYANTDFTAYTLEWGEVELGFMGMRAGLLPGVQVGSSPALNVAGLYNGQIKISAIHTGPLDVAGLASHYRHDGGMTGRLTSAGLTSSLRILDPWSIHATGSYMSASLSGLPEVNDTIASTVLGMTGWDVQAFREQAAADGVALNAEAELLTVKLATDIRFNRRDSLILQGQAAVWGRVDTDTGTLELPEELGLEAVLQASEAGAIPLSEAYTATASWQWSWKRSYLRVGAGVSSVQGAWLLQSTEFAWRFGGETKRTERHLRQSWRHNRRGLRKGADSTVAAATPPPEPEAP